VLSSVGLPGLNGFVGEYLILLGSFQAAPLWACVGVTGVVFGAVYLLSATRRVLFGAVTRDENRRLTDLDLREVGLMVPLVVLVVWIGVRPAPFLDRTAASVEQVVQRVEAARAVARAPGPDGEPLRVAQRGER
jgi:NADH-quinone oxidoreductase subunit M